MLRLEKNKTFNLAWLEDLLQKHHVQLPITLFWFVHSLVPGWPKEGDLPHRQPGAVLRPSRNPFGVSNPALSTQCHPFYLTMATGRRSLFSLLLHRKKPLLFYFNILKCASPLVLLEFQCPTTQVRLPSFDVGQRKHDSFWSTILTVSFYWHCSFPAMRGTMSWPAPHPGESQGGQQRWRWLLQAVLQGRRGLCQTGTEADCCTFILFTRAKNGILSFVLFCFVFLLMQSPPEILKEGLCPAMLMPSKACKENVLIRTFFCVCKGLG